MSLSPPDASAFADELARAVVDGSPAEWAPLAAKLENLSGRGSLPRGESAQDFLVDCLLDMVEGHRLAKPCQRRLKTDPPSAG